VFCDQNTLVSPDFTDGVGKWMICGLNRTQTG